MVAWEPGHGGLAAAASGATRRGSRAPGAPDRGSRQRIDGSQLAHSATQDGAEAKTVAAGGGGGTRESLGLAAWLPPEAEPSTRGQVWGRACSSAQIGERLGLHLQPTEATHASPSTAERSPIHLRSHATLSERHRGLDWNYWMPGSQGQSNGTGTGPDDKHQRK